jgi:hypothetical protein
MDSLPKSYVGSGNMPAGASPSLQNDIKAATIFGPKMTKGISPSDWIDRADSAFKYFGLGGTRNNLIAHLVAIIEQAEKQKEKEEEEKKKKEKGKDCAKSGTGSTAYRGARSSVSRFSPTSQPKGSDRRGRTE